MKKFTVAVALALLCTFGSAGISACKEEGGTPQDTTADGDILNVFAPDGAPALSVAGLSDASYRDRYDVNIVDAETIQTYVVGDDAQADIAVLPVNAAVKLLGTGEKYKLFGTVTHGNLYLMKKQGGTDITSENLNTLIGKTVGVINLANVPGLTFKAILSDSGLAFNELRDGASPAADKVNLLAIDAAQAVPSNTQCDYFVVPEPAATTKFNATGGKLSFAGDLQQLYAGGEGYPQAVAVAKTDVTADEIDDFIDALNSSEEWIKGQNTSSESIVAAVNSMMYKQGAVSTLRADNLTKGVIENCAIDFVPASECMSEILAYMQKINAVAAQSFGTPSDAFFYGV